MKMKKVNVELEIPENMEIGEISTNINVQLRPRLPRRLVFEEIVGQTYVKEGEYWSANNLGLTRASGYYNLETNEIAWKLIEE